MSTQPLLPTHRTLSKGKGKAPAPPSPSSSRSSTPPRRGFRAFDDDEREDEEEKGRCVTIRFTGDQGGDLDVWVEEGESVGSVKEKVSCVLDFWGWVEVECVMCDVGWPRACRGVYSELGEDIPS